MVLLNAAGFWGRDEQKTHYGIETRYPLGDGSRGPSRDEQKTHYGIETVIFPNGKLWWSCRDEQKTHYGIETRSGAQAPSLGWSRRAENPLRD